MDRKMMTLGSGFGALALLAGLTTVHGVGTHAARATAPGCPAPQGDLVSVQSTMAARRAIPRMAPRIPGRFADSSTNWSGYVVNGSAGSVTDVKGAWTVPAVTLGSGCASSYSAAWVGIDGDTDGTVEQCGTEQETSGRYYAWYEMYPRGSTGVAYVKPGDAITAEVKYQPSKNNFLLTMTVNGNTILNTAQKLPSAQRTSAEWIMEAPWSGGVLPLADFNPLPPSSFGFTGCGSNLGGPGSATSITMVSSSNSATVKALPGSVSSSGDGFSVTWMACQ